MKIVFENCELCLHTTICRGLRISAIYRESRNNSSVSARQIAVCKRTISPFSTRRLFSREATFSFVGIAFADVTSDADKGKSRFARKKSPSGKRALKDTHRWRQIHVRSRQQTCFSLFMPPKFFNKPFEFLLYKTNR